MSASNRPSLRMLSLNVNGLQSSPSKRRQLFHGLQLGRYDIICLQETHHSSEAEAQHFFFFIIFFFEKFSGEPSEEGKPLRQAGSLSQAGNPRWVAIEPIWQISGGETLSRLFSLPFEGTHAQSA